MPGQDLGEGAEAGKERPGERFSISALRGAEEDQLEKIVAGKGASAGIAEATSQPLAMAEIMGLPASLKPIALLRQ
jgi:hypothetical protein